MVAGARTSRRAVLQVLLSEHARYTKTYVYNTDTGQVVQERWWDRDARVAGFGHHCHGGLVAVYRWPPSGGDLLVQQGVIGIALGQSTNTSWTRRGLTSHLRMEAGSSVLQLSEVVVVGRLFPARDWDMDPDFLHWLAGLAQSPERFVAA